MLALKRKRNDLSPWNLVFSVDESSIDTISPGEWDRIKCLQDSVANASLPKPKFVLRVAS